MTASDGGKGSAPRPFSVSNEEYAARWDAIFGRDKPALPGCSGSCRAYSECPHRTPCDRVDEYETGMDGAVNEAVDS